MALVKLQMTNTRKYRQPMSAMAGLVTWPIRVLNAKETITPMLTPLLRVRVSKISAGMIQLSEPQVKEKEIW